MATDKVQTGTRLDYLVLQKITYIAKREHRSVNAQIELIVERCIAEYEKENGPIQLPLE